MELSQIAGAATAQARKAMRARNALGFAKGKSRCAIDGKLGKDNHTVNKQEAHARLRAARHGKPLCGGQRHDGVRHRQDDPAAQKHGVRLLPDSHRKDDVAH